MNLQPEAPSGEFAIFMWYQVSCSCGFVRDGVDVSTTKPGSCWFSIVKSRKVGMPACSQTAERVFDARRNKDEALVQLRVRRSTVRLAWVRLEMPRIRGEPPYSLSRRARCTYAVLPSLGNQPLQIPGLD
jgi:hypothetical protein